MTNWNEYSLGDIAEITSSKRIFYSDYLLSGIPFWRSKEVIEKSKNQEVSTELYISTEKYHEIKQRFGVPQENDILLTSVGTLGISYLVKKEDLFYFKDGNLTWLRNINRNLADPLFLNYWMKSPIGQDTLYSIAIGSTQPALTIIGLKGIKITLPINGRYD